MRHLLPRTDGRLQVINTSGVSIAAGAVVCSLDTFSNGLLCIKKAKGIAGSIPAVGFAVETIANGATGEIAEIGDIVDFDTSAWEVGDKLYVSTATAGSITNVRPSAPDYMQFVATVLVKSANGTIRIKIQGFQDGVYGAASLDSAGLVPLARLGSGTPDGTTVLAGSRTWVSTGGGGPHGHIESDIVGLETDLLSHELTASKEQVNGYAGLDAGGKLTGSRIPYGSTSTTACVGNDSRLSDSRTPTTHATSHKSGGSDAVKLDELAAPTDVTTLNASTSQHGLLPKLSGNALQFLNGTGGFTTPAAGDVVGPASAVDSNVAVYDGTTGKLLKDSGIALSSKQATSEKNAANGYAGLDASSKLTGTQQKYGILTNTACEGNDSRLSDSRTPTAHATTHGPGGSDPLPVFGRTFLLMGA